jgi:hypothetical protein
MAALPPLGVVRALYAEGGVDAGLVAPGVSDAFPLPIPNVLGVESAAP